METQYVATGRLERTEESGVGGCELDGLLDYVNGLPKARLAAAASSAWWRAMGHAKSVGRSRTAEMYIVSIATARIAEEGLLDLMNHF